jgi:hypothetical protein
MSDIRGRKKKSETAIAAMIESRQNNQPVHMQITAGNSRNDRLKFSHGQAMADP